MKMLSSVFSGIQGDCKGTAKQMTQSKDRYKMEARGYAFLLFLVNSWVQEGVSAFQQKQFERLLCLHVSSPFLSLLCLTHCVTLERDNQDHSPSFSVIPNGSLQQ
jgi:hypothetical protein